MLAAGLLTSGCIVALAQQTLRGTVTDAQGEPLIGVSVSADGKAVAVTDADGRFTLPSATASTKLELSYVGYKSKVLSVGRKSEISVVMDEDNHSLNEVVVVGYGTLRKNDLTGSVGSVGTEKLNEKGAPGVLANLQGAVAGVNITQSSGRTGGGYNIEIRGKNSINGSQNPLYVVDGVICSDIEFLNPQDIERIDVLKDASSTAIYGSRATAGVVMVTTKSGATAGKRAQKPVISYDGYYGVSKVARMPHFMDGDEFYKYRFLKFLTIANADYNGGEPIWENTDLRRCLLGDRTTGIYRMKELLEAGKTYNWRDFVLQDGKQQNHYLAVSGATESVNYHIGVGYQQEEGMYRHDQQDKFTLKGSMDAQLSKMLTAGFGVNMARTNHDYASDKAIGIAFRMNPFMQPYDEDGNINPKPGTYQAMHTDEAAFTSQISPLVFMDTQTSNTLAWNVLGNVYLQLQPLKELTLKTNFSPTFSYSRYGYFLEGGLEAEADPNEAQRTSSRGFSWTWDNTVTWDRMFADVHHVNVMALVSAAYSDGESDRYYFNNVLDGTYWWNVGTSNQGYNYDSSGSGYSETSLMSYALRANYSYKGRYMATATVRWDGSSKFAQGRRWGSFPSFALAWRVSEEPFMKKAADWLSNLKLRASYGVTGNNNVGNYATQLTVGGTVYYPFGSTYYQGMAPGGIVDKMLKWEKAREINIGLDFGFFGERIRGSVDWYNKKSTDLLYSVKLPLESGGTSVTTNIGSVRNRGIEVSLTTENIVTKDWRWTTTFNFAHNKNEVLEINGTGDLYNGDSATGNLFIGQPYNNVFYYEWDGLVTDGTMVVPDNEIARLKGFVPGETVKQTKYYYDCYGLVEGNPIIVDRNGDGKYTNDDKKLYKSDPAWTGSVTSNLQWKNLDFSFSIYAKQDYTVYSNFYREYLDLANGRRGLSRLQEDWYIPAGTMIDCDGMNPNGTFINPVYQETTHYGSYPFLNSGQKNDGFGTPYWNGGAACITDASFVKVKHITLGYTLPKAWTMKFGCSSLRIYGTVTNPIVFTDYKGYDPEWANASTTSDGPSSVTWQIGANIKF